jgi:gliding motility-associated-like protein
MRPRFLLFIAVLFPVLSFAQTITYPGTLNLCPASTKLLTATGFSGSPSFQWRKDGVNIPTAITSSYTATTIGSYDVIVTTGGVPVTYTAITLSAATNPVANFTFSPDGDCVSAPITFTNASSGNSPTYLWDFGDPASGTTANASTATSPVRGFTGTPGNGTQNFNVKLTATDADGCTANVTKSVSKKQMPSTALSGTTGKKTYNNETYYTVCGSGSGLFSFTNASTTTATNTNYQFVWGNGNPDFSSGTFATTTQTYSTGVYTLTYSVTGANTCIATVTQYVFVGTNPGVGIANPGGTDVCTGQTLTFPITSTAGNTTGTTYTVDFHDLTTPVVFNHPAPADVSHVFNINSCGYNNLTYNNSFYVSIVAANACQTSSSFAVPIYVSEKPVASFTVSATTVCANTNVSLAGNGSTAKTATNAGCTPGSSVWTVTPSTGFTVQSGTMGNDNASADPSLWTSGSDNLTIRFTVAGTYSIKLKTGNNSGCGSDEITKTVCVNATPTASFTIDQNTGCSNLAVATTNTSSVATCGTNTYAWTVGYSATSGCTPSTSSYTYASGSASSANPQFNFVNPGTYTIGLVNSVPGSCSSPQTTRTVIVKSKPVVNLSAASSICIGSTNPSATIGTCSGTVSSYAWTFSGGTPATASTQSPGVINYSAAGSFSIGLDVTNECGTTSVSQPITIKTPPDITVPANQVKCAGVTTGLLSFSSTTPGATFAWTNNATSVGLAASGNGSSIASFTLNNASAAAVTATINVIPTSSGCPGPPGVFTLTVNPKPSTLSVVSPVTYCQGATAVALTATPGTGNTLTWYNNPGLTGGSATALTPSTAVGGTTNYYVTQDNTFGCTSNASTIAVAVTTAVANNTITADQTICSGNSATTLTGTTPTGGTGSFTYQWQLSTNGGATWGTATGTSTSSSYSPGAITLTTSYRRNVSSGACSQINSNTVTITVDPGLANTGISANQSLCQGTPTALLTGQTATGGSGVISYLWESSLNNSTWSTIGGVSTVDYQPPILSASTYYRRTVSSGTCNVSATVLISVTPSINNNIISANQIICSGASATTLNGTTPTGGTGSFTYQWQSSINGGATWSNATGTSTSSSYSPGAITVTTSYRRNVSSGACSQINSNTITITVQPSLANTGIGSDQSICEGNSTALLVGQLPTGGSGTYVYQWESSLNNSSWTAIASTNTKDYQPTILTTTTYYRRIVTSGSCSITSASIKITIYNLPTAGTMSASLINTCFGSNVTLSTSGYVGTVKKWQYNFTPANPATWVDVISSNSSTVNFTNVTQSFSVRVIVMQDGSCPNEATGPGIPVTVSTPTVPGITASDATVCTNANSATINLTGQTGSVIRWETSINNGTSWSTVANTSTSINYLNLTTSTWYRAVVQSGFCPQAISTISKITVVPTVTPSNAGTDQSLCALTTVTLNANNPVVGTGNWSQTSGPTTTIANPSLRNTQVSGLQPGQTYQFTWLITGPGACPSSTDAVLITSVPAITQAVAGADQVVCSFIGPLDSVILNGNTLTNPGFEAAAWSILSKPSGSNPLIRSNTNPSTRLVFDKTGQYQLEYTISNGACIATKDAVTINVFDKPTTGSLTASAIIGCVGNSFTLSSGSALKGIISKWQYNFAAPNPATWIDTAITNPSILFSGMQQTFDARLITRSAGVALGCINQDTANIHIEIIPDFTNVIDTTSLSVCPGQSISIAGQLPSGAYNVFKYQWQQSKDGVNNWTDIVGQTAANLNMIPLITSYIRRLVIVSPCTKISGQAYVFVRPSVGNFLVSDSVGTCFPFDVTFTNLVLPSTATTWNFGDGAFNQGDQVTHTYHSTGTFSVVMTAQYPGGCKFEATKNIVVTGPKGILQYDHSTICANLPVYFEVASVGIDSVRWNFGDGTSVVSTGKNIYHSYPQPGPYVPYVELLAGADGTCRTRINGTDTLFVDLVKAGFKTSSIQNCASTQVSFTDTSRAFYGIKELRWDMGDGYTSTLKNPIHSYIGAKTWNVRQIATGNKGCSDTANRPVPVVIWDIPQIKTNKDSVACVGQMVPYVASVFSNDAIKSTTWSFSNGSGSTQLSAPKVYTFPGNYMAVFIATTINNCSDTIRLPVTVYPKPEIDLGPDLVLATGTLHPLKSTITNGPLSVWQWTPSADLSCASCSLPEATIKNNITYVVNAATQYGCKATDSVSIKVFCEDAQVYIPNVFTPDGDGLNDMLMVRAKGIRTVKSFRIFNRWGEVVFEKSNFAPNEKSNGWDGSIRGKKASPDVYVYTCEVVCENNVNYTYKGNITLVK